jgi:hypothetical protein
MSFGRQRNMVRRASRPDESFHRNRRRKAVDRLAMLQGAPRCPSLLSRLLRLLRIRGG